MHWHMDMNTPFDSVNTIRQYLGVKETPSEVLDLSFREGTWEILVANEYRGK